MANTKTKTKLTSGTGTITGKYSAVARDSNSDGGQNGRQASGMYPQVSRTKLAEACGRDVTTISQILRGRIRPRFDLALAMAEVVGVAAGQFEADWQRQRRVFEKEQQQAGRQ